MEGRKRLGRWLPAGLALASLAASLVPILLLAPSARAALDDFVYGTPVHFSLAAGGGLWSVLTAVWENVAYTYQDWQGTFSSVVLFSLEPGAFAPELYGLTAPVMLLAILCPVFLALGRIPGLERRGRLLLGGALGFLSVQYLPDPGQGLYWWNGAAHYLAFWCFSVMAVVWLTGLIRDPGKRFWPRIGLGCALALWVGGGNFCTALVLPVVCALAALWCLWRRKPRRSAAAGAAMALFALLGLAVSVAAPGNAVRQAGFSPLPPLAAIGRSFVYAARTLGGMVRWTTAASLVLCVGAFLWTWDREKAPVPRLHPLAVAAVSFCCFAALYTPPLYAMGGVRALEGRLENLFWVAAVFLVYGNALYTAAWAAGRVKLPARLPGALAAGGAAALLLALCLSLPQTNASLAWRDLNSPARETYLAERTRRAQLNGDLAAPAPRFQPLTAAPESFFQTRVVTWRSDLLVDGVPTALSTYHGRGGEVTYVELSHALEVLGRPGALAAGDCPRVFSVRGGTYVSLRWVCDALGYSIGYDGPADTIFITTG